MANSIVHPEVWNDALLEKINKVNVALNFVNPALTEKVLEQGEKVHVVTPGSITVGTYTKGTDVTVQDVTDVDEYLQVNDALYWAFDVDHIDRVQSNPQTVAGYMKEAGKAMSRAVDSYVFASHTAAATANKITGASNAALSLATNKPYALFLKAVRALNDQDAPQDERWIVISPQVHEALLSDTTNFVRASALGDLVVSTARFEGATARNTPGFVGQVLGLDVYLSTNLPVSTTNHYLIYGQGQPIDYVSQFSTVEAVPLPRQFGTALKGLILHGKKVFAENAKRLGSIYVTA